MACNLEEITKLIEEKGSEKLKQQLNKKQTEDNTGLVLFKLGVAQALGLDVDKMTDKTILDKELKNLVDIDFINKKITFNDKDLEKAVTKNDMEAISDYALKNEQYHTVLAISELIKLKEAFDSGKMKHTTDMTIEEDGITNGMILTLLSMGLNESTAELLFKGGVYTKSGLESTILAIKANDKLENKNKIVKELREKFDNGTLTHGWLKEVAKIEDFYEQTGSVSTKILHELQCPVLDKNGQITTNKLGEEVTESAMNKNIVQMVGDEIGRKEAKTGTMSTVYGQGVTSTLNSTFNNIVIPNIEKHFIERIKGPIIHSDIATSADRQKNSFYGH